MPITVEQARKRMIGRQQGLRRRILAAHDQERYQGHGDLDLDDEERALLRECHFEPWGRGGWVRFAPDGSEQGGTCYDDKWAMSEALALTAGGEAA